MSVYVPAVEPKSKMQIEAEAAEIIRSYCPQLLSTPGEFPVLRFFDHVLPRDYGLDTGVEYLSDGVEGMTWPDGRVLLSPETYRGAGGGGGRHRFTVAHECYHGIMHHRQIRRVLVDAGGIVLHRRFTIEAFRDPEWQADQFAGSLLMPQSMVEHVARRTPRLRLVQAIASAFGVSTRAAEVRLAKLGMG